MNPKPLPYSGMKQQIVSSKLCWIWQTLLLCCVLSLSLNRAHAVLRAYEGFNYTSGTTFLSSNGGFGFANAWQTNSTSASAILTNRLNSLSYTDTLGKVLLTSGGSVFLSGAGGSCQPLRNLTNTFGTNGGTMWFSFLGQRSGPATNSQAPLYQRVASVQLHTNGSERISVGRATWNSENNASTNRWDTWAVYTAGSGANTFASTNALTNVSFLVLRVDYVVGLDTAYLFVNPPDLTTAPDISTAAATNTISDVPFDRIRLFTGNTTSAGLFAELAVDELRVGDSFTDVAPVVTIPNVPLKISTVLLQGGNIVLNGSGGTNGGPFTVLESASVVTPVSLWTTNGSGSFSGSGLFFYTNLYNPGAAENYFRIRQP